MSLHGLAVQSRLTSYTMATHSTFKRAAVDPMVGP